MGSGSPHISDATMVRGESARAAWPRLSRASVEFEGNKCRRAAARRALHNSFTGRPPQVAPTLRTCHQRDPWLAARSAARHAAAADIVIPAGLPSCPQPIPTPHNAGPRSLAARATNPQARSGTMPAAAAIAPLHQHTPTACHAASRAAADTKTPLSSAGSGGRPLVPAARRPLPKSNFAFCSLIGLT